jgi:hypothetical protein
MIFRNRIGMASASIMFLLWGSVAVVCAESGESASDKEIISKLAQSLPGKSLVPQANLNFVLLQIISIGIKQRPQCKDYRVHDRKTIASENSADTFKEIWDVEMCGERKNFVVIRSRIGIRELHLSVGLEK